MDARKSKITSAGMGLLLALAAGAPALADDTELMLATPEVDAKPNILFLLDTSGSMEGTLETKAAYDHAKDYSASGDCDSDSMYWTDVGIVPNCLSFNRITDSAFKCDAANGRLTGIGSYSGTMAQYRETADPEVNRWQELDPGNHTAPVECMADSGEHGSGAPGQVYATNAGGDGGFTSDASLELAWGSAPAAVTYTVYDGNYLNWKNSSTTVVLERIEILKDVATAVLTSVSDVNVGIMRFNGSDGGLVIKAMSDLNDDVERANILQTIDELPAQGGTPLAEVMYEAAHYWRGQSAYFGAAHAATDAAALTAGNYVPPVTQACSRNFNILLSDGEPDDGNDEAPDLVGDLPGFAAPCDGTGVGACLDDIAKNLATVDIDASLAGDQLVTTHTIGFAIDTQSLQETAEDSGGRYFLADDVETLTTALLRIITDITEGSQSFTAPAVSVNSFNRTQNLNDLYLTVFSAESNIHWPGNLKKYTVANGRIVDAAGQPAIDPDTGFFRDGASGLWAAADVDGNVVTAGGAAHQLPLPADRTLFTNSGSGGALVALADADLSEADFGLTPAPGAAGEPTVDEMISWMRGVDIRDEDLDRNTTEPRNAMGDPLHSQPAAVVYGGDADTPDVVVFTGTNDGYLHAIDGDTGKELWAFVPMELLGDMNRLFFNPGSNFKHYGIDGNIVPAVFDKDHDGLIETNDGDFVYIVFGLRRGGNSYYALDVTDRDSPKLLWQAAHSEFGQTWSTPVITRVDVNGTDDEENAVVIVGGGYDTVHDTPAFPASADELGAGVHMLDLKTGETLWWAGPDGSGADLELDDMTRAIPTRVRVIDLSGDGRADRMYAADIGGQIWRFDIRNGAAPTDLVEGGVIARLGAEGAGTPNTRRFYNSPDVAIFNDPLQNRRYISISIGSGYRAHPLNDDAADMFFSIRDPDVFNPLSEDEYENYNVVTVEDLELANGETLVGVGPEDRGWKFQLPADQAVIAGSTTFDDSVFFVGFSPRENRMNPCQPSIGRNFLYEVSVVNGHFAVNNADAEADDPATEGPIEIEQSGIAPAPAVLFPGSTNDQCEGAECKAPPIFCVGAECFNPGFDNYPVRTLWTQDGVE